MLVRLIIFILFAASPSGTGPDRTEGFEEEFEYLCWQHIPDVGRDAVVAAFEGFIEEYADHPRVAEAMIVLGRRMRQGPMRPGDDSDRPLAWFRKAVAKSRPGSETWIEAQFCIVHRYVGEDRSKGRPILAEIAAQAQGDIVTLATVEDNLHDICIAEGDLDGAEHHFRRLLDWDRLHGPIPVNTSEEITRKNKIDSMMRYGASTMVGALTVAPMPKAERESRIKKLMADHMWFSFLQKRGMRALIELKTKPEWHGVRTEVPLAADTGWTAWVRWTLTVFSLVALLGLGWLFLLRRRPQT